jgi:hypothetical protein
MQKFPSRAAKNITGIQEITMTFGQNKHTGDTYDIWSEQILEKLGWKILGKRYINYIFDYIYWSKGSGFSN